MEVKSKEFEDMKVKIYSYMWEAFMLGSWYGQAEMEQHMDNNFLDNVMESLSAKKTSCPMFNKSNGRTVRYNLRSDKWRKAIFSKKEKFKELITKFCDDIDKMNKCRGDY